MGWAVFQTYGLQERKAVENLGRQGLTAFSPFYVRADRLRGRKDAPLFPCYGFVELIDQSQWGKPNNTYGIIRLLTDRNRVSPKPLWVADSYVTNLQGLQIKVGELLPVNTIVRVRAKGNPFYDLIGTVIGMTKDDRIKLLMSLFKRDIVVEFVISDLEVVDDF